MPANWTYRNGIYQPTALLDKSEASCKMSFSRTITKLRIEKSLLGLLLLYTIIRYIR